MQKIDFPAIYRSADSLSLGSQSTFFNVLKAHLAALVVASVLSFVNFSHWSVATLQLVALLIALSCSVFLFVKRPDRLWYAGRVVAESIKTIAWRYVCRAEPFDIDDSASKKEFTKKLRQIIEQNRDVARSLTKYLDEAQITSEMERLRGLPLVDRRQIYSDRRISDQLSWYANKAGLNRTLSRNFFAALIAVNGLAVVVAAIRIAHPEVSFWPTDILVTLAASLLSWMQARRYSELASSYALAASEIGLIKEEVMLQSSEGAFSSFVGDAENAFSREHTQWVARKDV